MSQQQQHFQFNQQPQRLMHPTSYHLQQMQRTIPVNGRDNSSINQSSMAYSPYATPQSLGWNPNMMDPHYSQDQQKGNLQSPTGTFAQQNSPTSTRTPLPQNAHQHVFQAIKEEPKDSPSDFVTVQGDIGYTADPSRLSTVLSPLSSPSGLESPLVTQEDDITGSAKSPYGISPPDQDLYSPAADSGEYYFDSNDIPTSPENPPLNISSPMDGKIPRMGTSSINIVRNSNHHNGHFNTLNQGNMGEINSFHSMSMPVHGVDWFGAQSASLGGESILPSTLGGHPHSLQYSHNGPLSANAADISLMQGIFDSDEGDSTIAMGAPVVGDLSIAGGSKLGHSLPAGSSVQMLYEKRRRRRESHNAVERRRRDNINEKIQELSTLLPDCLVDSTNKPNKGVILRKSVDYIRQLQQLVQQQGHRNQELEHILSTTTGLASPTSNGMQMHNGHSGVPIGGISAALQTQNRNRVGGIGMAFGQIGAGGSSNSNANGSSNGSTVSF